MKAPAKGERSEQCPEFFKNVKGLPIRTHFQKHSPTFYEVRYRKWISDMDTV
jgi:hypothetical protein